MSRVRGRQSVGELLLDWSIDQPLPDRRLPVALLSKSQKAAELQRVQARRAMDAAYEAELVMGLADDTPDTLDLPAGHPGAKKGSWAPDTELPGVSEFFTAELAVVLNCGRGTASHLAQRAWLYRESLPATWAAMAEGELDEPRAKVLADVLAHTAPAIARAVEAQVLREATGLSLGRLKARALALLIKLDADAVNARRKDAQRHANVRSYPSQLEGMSTLAADLPTPVSAECLDVVDQLAAMLKADGDPRPIGELRAAVLADLIRRPWDTRLPAVTARLHITAPLPSLAGHSAEPGEVGGQPITACHLRELVAQLGFLGLQTPECGSLTFAITDAEGRLLATASHATLQRLARRGCREHPDRDCRCPVLGAPAGTTAYSPTGAQDEWVRTRDRTCRFPNCGQRAGWADLDHVVPHSCGGETVCANLCCLCRSHHRLKTHARGWSFVMDPDGVLHVTTPSGITRSTRPPGLRPPEPSEPRPEAAVPPRAAPDDDPPPF
jgi:5-methylcytosine-specific restriction endonuclease McrA